MRKPTLLIATALSTLALAGVVGVGVASADPTPAASPSATTSPTAGAPTTAPTTTATSTTAPAKPGTTAKHQRQHHHALAQRALHGEVVLGGKKHRVLDFQRGTVTAVSASSITVRSTDDFAATYVVDAKTKVRRAQEPTTIGEVKSGDKVRVVARKDGSTLTATRVADRTK